MANPFHHSQSSVKKWGGKVDNYLAIHEWFDETKAHHGDFRHRALRHHTQGIYECQLRFGTVILIEGGRLIPVRWVAEQHVTEDCGYIPSVSDWLSCIEPKGWMNKPRQLSRELA